MTPTLRAHHLDDLRRSGLSDATIAALGFYSVTRQEAGKVLTFDPGSDCMAIPFPSVDGQKPFLRFKPDTPLTIPGQERAAKYLSPKGADNRLYIPPATRSLLQNADAAIIITEGEKKGAKADQEGFACVGLTGVECWRQKPRDAQGRKVDDADSVPIPDLDLVTWRKRTVFLVFDSDIVRKPEVRRALWALRGELVRRGAIVHVVYLPDGKDGAKVGLDDFLVGHGVDALRKLLDDAPVLDWQQRVRDVLDTPEGQGRDDLIRELLVDLTREADALTRDRVRKTLVDGKALTARTFDDLAKECEPKGSGSSEPGQVE
ncbi:MAG: DUF3854 domain-containing protein, partial [Planctomycetes bacterium]|nr:DUF3854 domain-containing protein [Planctomycetota bacterium]